MKRFMGLFCAVVLIALFCMSLQTPAKAQYSYKVTGISPLPGFYVQDYHWDASFSDYFITYGMEYSGDTGSILTDGFISGFYYAGFVPASGMKYLSPNVLQLSTFGQYGNWTDSSVAARFATAVYVLNVDTNKLSVKVTDLLTGAVVLNRVNDINGYGGWELW